MKYWHDLALMMGAGALVAAGAIPMARSLDAVVGRYLHESELTGLIFIIFVPFIVSLLVAQAAGWYARAKWQILAAGGAASYYLFESGFRFIRVSGIESPASFFLLRGWLVKEMAWLLLAVALGLALGAWLGAKARRENHRLRLFVFSALLMVLIAVTLSVDGPEAFNALSDSRGIL